MPDSVSLNVTVGGQGVHLELQVDQSVDRDVPVFILSSNENGELETRRVALNKTEVGILTFKKTDDEIIRKYC